MVHYCDLQEESLVCHVFLVGCPLSAGTTERMLSPSSVGFANMGSEVVGCGVGIGGGTRARKPIEMDL